MSANECKMKNSFFMNDVCFITIERERDLTLSEMSDACSKFNFTLVDLPFPGIDEIIAFTSYFYLYHHPKDVYSLFYGKFI